MPLSLLKSARLSDLAEHGLNVRFAHCVRGAPFWARWFVSHALRGRRVFAGRFARGIRSMPLPLGRHQQIGRRNSAVFDVLRAGMAGIGERRGREFTVNTSVVDTTGRTSLELCLAKQYAYKSRATIMRG